MTSSQPKAPSRRVWLWVALAFFAGLLIMAAVAFMLTNIQTRKSRSHRVPLEDGPDRSQ